MEVFAIVTTVGLVACAIGVLIGRASGGMGVTIYLGVIAAFAAFFGVMTEQASGYDVFLWIALLLGVAAPSAVGGLIGGLVGISKSQRAAAETQA